MSLPVESKELPYLRNIGLLMTYRCQIACSHCIIEAGPHRKEEILLADASDWIKQVAEYRGGHIRFLSLTGGEPFYNIKNLKEISALGDSCGLIISAVTNAFWASTPQKANKVLKGLSAIKLLAISTDVHHQESVPIEWVKNAVLSAEESNIPCNVCLCTENENDKDYIRILKSLEGIIEKDNIKTVITFPVGRYLQKKKISKYRTSKEPPISACSSSSSPVIFPDGRVTACVGPIIDITSSHPLILGNLRKNTLQEILDKAELNPILHAIRIWGPKMLISIIQKAGLGHYLPEHYIKDSICNACYNLMSNTKIVDFLFQLTKNLEFKRKVANARLYYLNEARIVELSI